jgi:hypothetical protein
VLAYRLALRALHARWLCIEGVRMGQEQILHLISVEVVSMRTPEGEKEGVRTSQKATERWY